MEINKQDNTLTILDKTFNYEESLNVLATVDSKFWCSLFLEVGVTLPRAINVQALRLALNKKIVIAKELGLTDELLFRLRCYPYFTEYQLQQFFIAVCDEELFFDYKKNLGKLILQNFDLLSMPEELLFKALNYKQNIKETFTDFQNNIFNICYDFNNFFDGQEYDNIREYLVKGATTNEIRELGSKYGLNIPKRLKKEELQQIIIEELTEQNKLDDALLKKINSSAAIALQRIAKNNGIKVSIDLKKDELIELLFKEIKKSGYQTKDFLFLNLYLGDDFVFNLSYVVKEEEKPEPEVVVEPEVVAEPEVIETPVVEEKAPEVAETLVEEVKEEVKPKENNDILVDNVRVVEPISQNYQATINIDTDQLVKALGETIKDTVSEITKQILPLVQNNNVNKEPVINVYNQLKKEEVFEEEKPEEKIYEFDNFVNQENPYFDADIAKTMNLADKLEIEPKYEEEIISEEENKLELTPEINLEVTPEEEEIEEEIDLEGLSPEEVKVIKKTRKEEKKAKLAEKKKIAKQQKLEIKKQKNEEKLANKEALKAEKEKKKEEEKQQRLQAIEAEKQAKLDAKNDKANAKLDKKNAKKAEKERIAEYERNQKALERAIKTGIMPDGLDEEYFNKQIKLLEYRDRLAKDERELRRERNKRRGNVVKWIITIILLIAIAYFTVCACISLIPTFEDYMKNYSFFKEQGFGGVSLYDNFFAFGEQLFNKLLKK